jgi:hypothetical protein
MLGTEILRRTTKVIAYGATGGLGAGVKVNGCRHEGQSHQEQEPEGTAEADQAHGRDGAAFARLTRGSKR